MPLLNISANLPEEYIDVVALVKWYDQQAPWVTKQEFVTNYYLSLIKEDMKFVFEVYERKKREEDERKAKEKTGSAIDNLFIGAIQ